MFLKDKEILEYVNNKKLIAMEFDEKHLTPSGYDLRVDLGSSIKSKSGGEEFYISSVKCLTTEYLKIPDDIIGLLFLKSKYCRKGVWGNFGLVDAGFEGKLEFTLFRINVEVFEESIENDIPVVQIIFYKLDDKVGKNYAKRSGNFQFYGLELGDIQKIKYPSFIVE
ncbi:MAG: dCTP deaminase [Candidatus Parvarchaeum sp.]